MTRFNLVTRSQRPIPYVDEAQLREVDRIAVEEFNLSLLQMMENAGRSLALQAIAMLAGRSESTITVAAGSGGNGGGGLCAARHLHNRGYTINLLLTKPQQNYQGAAGAQLAILQQAGVSPLSKEQAHQAVASAHLVIDALIGYSLQGPPRGSTKTLIDLINQHGGKVLSLDLPSGIDATSGAAPGAFIQANRTLTLALPKSGLTNPASGRVFLADIGIPPQVFTRVGIKTGPIFTNDYVIELLTRE